MSQIILPETQVIQTKRKPGLWRYFSRTIESAFGLADLEKAEINTERTIAACDEISQTCLRIEKRNKLSDD